MGSQLFEKYNEFNKYRKNNRKKEGFCSFVTSKKWEQTVRDDFFKKLSAYKKVDSGGRYLNNIGYKVDNKLEFLNKYKFNIAFENSSTLGYTTEKIVDAFVANTVPIYWGNKDITKDFNSKAFINCNEFDTFEEAIDYIKMVDNDAELYNSYFEYDILTKEAQKYLTSEYLDNFLYNIIDQGREQALRRTIGFYYESLDEMNIRKLEKIKKPIRTFKKIISRKEK